MYSILFQLTFILKTMNFNKWQQFCELLMDIFSCSRSHEWSHFILTYCMLHMYIIFAFLNQANLI